MQDMREELKFFLNEIGALYKKPCTDEENKELAALKSQDKPLPEGIHAYNQGTRFYRFIKGDYTEKEIDRLIMLKQVKLLSGIKSCLIFIVIIMVFFLISYFCSR